MAQIFHPGLNPFARGSLLGGLVLLVGTLWFLRGISRSSYVTHTRVIRPQPVPFSHKHHVSGIGIDCRHCHTSVEESSFAGMPPTATCMNCHSQIWADSPALEPVRASLRDGRPIAWTRVHNLPDFAYFDHSIHVRKGVACTTCHGPVDRMPLLWQESSLLMEWCLDCHRSPEKHLPAGARVENPTDCSHCHR